MIKFGKNKNYLFFSIGFGITLIVFILFIFIYKGSYENFANNITFMTKEESQIFMQKDEDYYIRNLSIYDLRARKVATNDDYLKIAINSCMDFNESQKEKLTYCCNEAIKFFNNNYNWTIALTNNTYEEGFPHTRGTVIFLSPLIINYTHTELTKTLIHESIHVFQRYNKEEMNKYLTSNGYSISRLRNKNSLIRSNPDLDEYIYKNKNGDELIAYYRSEFPLSINDVHMSVMSEEHPYEKMAYEIADEYIKSLMSKYKNI